MKAVTYQGIKHVEVKEVPDPEIEKPDDIIGHELPLLEAAHAYKIFDQKKDNCIKVVLKP